MPRCFSCCFAHSWPLMQSRAPRGRRWRTWAVTRAALARTASTVESRGSRVPAIGRDACPGSRPSTVDSRRRGEASPQDDALRSPEVSEALLRDVVLALPALELDDGN